MAYDSTEYFFINVWPPLETKDSSEPEENLSSPSL